MGLHLVGGDLVEVVGGQGSQGKKNDEDGKRPNRCLALVLSTDPNLLCNPFQPNTTKQHINLLLQSLYLLNTVRRELVLEKTFVNLFGFLFKVGNHKLKLLQ